MKKQYYIIFLLTLFLAPTVSAQKRIKMNKDKIQAYKVAYITEKLDLTEQEAKEFWPVYNAHEKKTSEIRAKEGSTLKKLFKDNGSLDLITEQEAKSTFNVMAELQERAYLARKEYHNKLKKIISHKKIIKLQMTEREFRRHLFEKMRKERRERN